MDQENPLWRWSLAVYAAPAVRAACLELQDVHGCDVNLLLAAGFLADRGIDLSGDRARELESRVAGWRSGFIHPLRALRRRSVDFSEAESLTQSLLAAELEAERVEQSLLWGAMSGWGISGDTAERAPGPAQLANNLRAVTDLVAAPVGAASSLESALAELAPGGGDAGSP
jgi:uncharacterized protein (TIGR02444 family)